MRDGRNQPGLCSSLEILDYTSLFSGYVADARLILVSEM